MSTRPDCVHLHLHTEFSLLDGAIRHDALMDQVVAHGSKAVGMTDHLATLVRIFSRLRSKGQRFTAAIADVVDTDRHFFDRSRHR